MADTRTILREWFQSGKKRPLSLAECNALKAMDGKEYLRVYAELEREVKAARHASASGVARHEG